MAFVHPAEPPKMVHPAQDQTMSPDEQAHVRALVHTHAAGVSYALGRGDETAINQGVPPTVRYRAMFWATLHRTAMNASHYLAIVKAEDGDVQKAAQELGDAMRDLIIKQMEGSREVVGEIEARQ